MLRLHEDGRRGDPRPESEALTPGGVPPGHSNPAAPAGAERPAAREAGFRALYGVETKRVNEAVRNNPDKFPPDYLFELDADESRSLRTKISTLKPEGANRGAHSKYNYKAFTEKGLYMLATVLKSRRATETTFAIIETFAKVRALKRDLVALHEEPDAEKKAARARRFGELLADVVMPDADAVETESSLELNFLVGKIKHTVRKIRKNPSARISSEQGR